MPQIQRFVVRRARKARATVTAAECAEAVRQFQIDGRMIRKLPEERVVNRREVKATHAHFAVLEQHPKKERRSDMVGLTLHDLQDF